MVSYINILRIFHIKTLVKTRKNEVGATAIEYGLIAALISVGIIGTVSAVGTNLSNVFGAVSSHLGNAVSSAPARGCYALCISSRTALLQSWKQADGVLIFGFLGCINSELSFNKAHFSHDTFLELEEFSLSLFQCQTL